MFLTAVFITVPIWGDPDVRPCINAPTNRSQPVQWPLLSESEPNDGYLW